MHFSPKTTRIPSLFLAMLVCSVCVSSAHAWTPQLTVKSSKATAKKRAKEEDAKKALEAEKAELAKSKKPKANATPAPTKKTASKDKAEKDKPEPKSSDDVQQASTEEAKGVTFSNPVEYKWRVGVVAKAGGEVANAVFAFPVPKNWPEQTVSLVEDTIEPAGNVEIRNNDQGLEQFVVRYRQLLPNQKVVITKTFMVTTSQIDKPDDTSVFVRPTTRMADARKYLKPSPGMNHSNSKIKKTAKKLGAGKETVWEEVEAIYDLVRDNIEDVTTDPGQISKVFLKKKGCNEDKVSLFVGMCRATKVPARIVWVQGTIYAEFMLVDGSGKIHWFPCNVGGVREFGSLAEPKIILQKGDNFRVPEMGKNQKYAGEVFQGSVVKKGNPRPIYKFFSELLID